MAFYQSNTDEDTCKCICGKQMKLYLPSYLPPPPMVGAGLPPINQLQGFCSICRVQLLPNSYAFECKAKSDRHPGPTDAPYQICSRCARYSATAKHRKTKHFLNSNAYNNYAPPHISHIAVNPMNPYNVNYSPLPKHIPYRISNQFHRFLHTKNKQKHYSQVHQLINCASETAIINIFNKIRNLSDKKKRHLLHTLYDHFESDSAGKYEQIGCVDDSDDIGYEEIEDMPIGPSRLCGDEEKKCSIMEDLQKHIIKDNEYNELIAGNVNVAYANDDDFLIKNAHLYEQQLNEMKRIKMEQIQLQKDVDQIVNGIENSERNDDGNNEVQISGLDGNDDSNEILPLSSAENENENMASKYCEKVDIEQMQSVLINDNFWEEFVIRSEIDKVILSAEDKIRTLQAMQLISKLRNVSLKSVRLTDDGVKIIANKTKCELMAELNKNNGNIHLKACLLGLSESDIPQMNIVNSNNQILPLSSAENGNENHASNAVDIVDENENNALETVENESANLIENDAVNAVENESLPANDNENELLISDKLKAAAENVKVFIEKQQNSDVKESVNETNEESKIEYKFEITNASNNKETSEITQNEITLTQTINNMLDTAMPNTVDSDDDIDLTGIQFDTRTQDTLDNISTIAVDGNEDECDEKLHMLAGLNNNHTPQTPRFSLNSSDSESENHMYGDLCMAELENLFGCTIGDNLTEDLGQDLWWYRVFVFLPKSEMNSIMRTCRYFYYMKVYHELVHNHIIDISSLPALVWKLAIFKDFKIEEKFKKSMKYIRIRFIDSMDWNAKLSPKYMSQLDLIKLPDTKQIYIEYLSVNSGNLDPRFLKMANMMFAALFRDINSVNYIELINKTNNKDFTWKLGSFTNMICTLKKFNRLRVPCFNQDLFNAKIYSHPHNTFEMNTFLNIEYIYLTEMKFENFSSLLPDDNAGIEAVNYFQQLQKLKGITLIFGEDTNKKKQEMISVSECVMSLLEMLKDSIQYIILGVHRLEQFIYNPFRDSESNDPKNYRRYGGYEPESNDESCIIPEYCDMYEFNYAFKPEIKKIF